MGSIEPEELAAEYLIANGYFITRLGPSSSRGWIRAAMLAVRLRRGPTSDPTESAADPALQTDDTLDDILLVESFPWSPRSAVAPPSHWLHSRRSVVSEELPARSDRLCCASS